MITRIEGLNRKMDYSADNGEVEEEGKRDDRKTYRNHLGIHDMMKQTVMRPNISNNPPDTLLRMTKL